ncbi:hypothetical protein [Paenibacillus puerhi]|uniref:hypothetical protein n=1 Tax=Paenibacillus puerhi TaxID=2692622 RepID=UPI00135AFE91|nr:hypothetical protein [Paenibacillus puerhi]
MKLKVMIVSGILLIMIIFMFSQFFSKKQQPTEVFEAPVTNILLQKDEQLTESGKYKGEAHYEFNYSNKDNRKIHYIFSDKNKRGMRFIIYSNNKSNIVSEGHTSKENNFLLEKTFSPQQEGSYEITVVSDDGDGGANSPISILVELAPN